MTKLKEFFIKHYLIVIGGVMFILYFWNRFIRSRTSKTIPVDLTTIRFFIYIYICLIFAYILISLLRPKKQNELIEQFVNFLFIPVMEFDKYLKSLSFIKPFYEKSLIYVLPKLEYLIIKTNIFYIIFWIFPRLILLTALFVDVFVFHRLHYKYMVILFGLLLFLNRYIKYSLKNTKEQLIQYYSPYIKGVQTDYYPGVHPSEFEPDYDPDEEEGFAMFLPLDIFINHHVNFHVYHNIIVNIHKITCKLALSEELWEKHIKQKRPPAYLNRPIPVDYTNIFGTGAFAYFKAQDLVFAKMREFEDDAMNKLFRISLIVEYYNYTSNQDQKIKNLKILIYLNYLLCWLYVLIISLPTLDILELLIVINTTWLTIGNPFI